MVPSSREADRVQHHPAPTPTFALHAFNRRGPISTPQRTDLVSHSGGNNERRTTPPPQERAVQQVPQDQYSPSPHSGGGTIDRTPPQQHVTEQPASPIGGATAFLQWDAKRSGPCVLSSNGTVALAERSPVYHMAGKRFKDPNTLSLYTIGTIGIARGELVFEVVVDLNPLSVGQYCVGVASKYFRGPQGKRCPAYLLRSDGGILPQSDASQVVPYTSPFPGGAKVTIHLDMNRWELSFYVNGKALGVAFRFTPIDDPEPLFPVVVFTGEGDSVVLQPPTADTLPAHVSPRRKSSRKKEKAAASPAVAQPQYLDPNRGQDLL